MIKPREVEFQANKKENKNLAFHVPCDFMDAEGECILGGCRPESCKNYPYTNQPDRWQSLYSVLDVIRVCPVAFEIFETERRVRVSVSQEIVNIVFYVEISPGEKPGDVFR